MFNLICVILSILICKTKLSSSQEAQNPPRPGEGGRQLKGDDARRTNIMNWLARCSIL